MGSRTEQRKKMDCQGALKQVLLIRALHSKVTVARNLHSWLTQSLDASCFVRDVTSGKGVPWSWGRSDGKYGWIQTPSSPIPTKTLPLFMLSCQLRCSLYATLILAFSSLYQVRCSPKQFQCLILLSLTQFLFLPSHQIFPMFPLKTSIQYKFSYIMYVLGRKKFPLALKVLLTGLIIKLTGEENKV